MARELKVVLTGDNRDLARAFKSADKDAGRFEGRLSRTADRAKGAFMAIGAAAATGLGLAAKQAIAAASDVDESLTKNQQLFGQSAKTIDAWSKTTASSMGVSRKAALEATGTFGGLFSALEIGERPAADMSVRLTKLAADLASFNNASPEEALEALRSGLAGESEPMRRFNAFLSEGRVKLEAYRSGIAKQGSELTEQQKVQARYNLILKDTTKAHGDFARTSGGLANQQRILKAELTDASTALGEELLPVATDAARALTKFIGQMKDGKGAGGEFADVARDVAKVLGAVGGFLKDNPKLIAAAAAAWGTYKVASLAALAAIKVQSFRAAFAKGTAPAASQGALAGRTYATSFAGSSATAMPGALGKQQGKFTRTSRVLGNAMGLATAAAFVLAFRPEIEKAMDSFADDVGTFLDKLGDLAGETADSLVDPFRGGKSPAARWRDSNRPSVGQGDSTPLHPNVPPGARLPKPDRESNRPRRRRPSRPGQRHGGRASASTARVGARASAVGRASQGGSGIIALGRQLQGEGYAVGEHPAFGGVAPVHTQNSYHYRGLAIDVNGGPGGEPGSLDALYARLQGRPGVVELLWRVKGHFDHLHVAVVGSTNPLGGSSPTSAAGEGLSGSRRAAAPSRPAAPVVRPMSASARAQQAFENSQLRTQVAARNAGRRAAGRRVRRGIPGRAPGKGVEHGEHSLEDVLAGVAEREAALPSFVDFLDRDAAMAALTEGSEDDLDVARKREQFWRDRLWDAMQTADPRDDIEAATNLKSATEAIEALTGEMEARRRMEEQDRAINKEIVENQRLLLKLAQQGDQIVAAVVAAVNGGIGGRLGLGFQSPGYAGGVTRY